MSMVHHLAPARKAGRSTPCRACDALGWTQGSAGGEDCSRCGGVGFVIEAGDDGTAPPMRYVASQPGGDIEEALTLEGVIEAVNATWVLRDEEVCVWRISGEGRGPRVAAVIRPGVRGNSVQRIGGAA